MTTDAQSQPIVVAGMTRLPFMLCVVVILSATFLQKIAVPGSAGALSVTLLVLPGVIAIGLVTNAFLINVEALVYYVIVTLIAWVSLLHATSAQASVMSLLLFAVVQLPLVLRFRPDVLSYEDIIKLVGNLAFLFAIFAMVQFSAQFVVGRTVAYFIDFNLPAEVAIKGFDFLVPLYWLSPDLKSNGFFFAEPSLLSQFLAIGIVAELVSRVRLYRLAALFGGLVCSYSGTGMMTLAFFLPIYIVQRRRYDILVFGIVAIAILLPFSEALQLDAITRRLSEFSSTQSSGFARFMSIFYTLGDFMLTDPATALLGRGPGTVMENFRRLSYEAFDPTWGKLVYEYGLIGGAAYLVFFYQSVLRVRRPMTFPLVFTYALLGGYLLNAFVVSQILVIVTWTAGQPWRLDTRQTA